LDEQSFRDPVDARDRQDERAEYSGPLGPVKSSSRTVTDGKRRDFDIRRVPPDAAANTDSCYHGQSTRRQRDSRKN
jgi:hypothetical protein